MQAMQCTGPCVTAIRRAGLHHYLEFLPVTSAFVYDRAAARLRRVPARTADVHSAEGLSAAQRRQLWLVMREVERGASGGRTSLFGTGDFEAALQGCGLPRYVEVCFKAASASSLDHYHIELCASCGAADTQGADSVGCCSPECDSVQLC